MSNVLEALDEFLAAADSTVLRRPVLLAVSGGADSVALLDGMRELSGKFALRLEVIHFNHQLRGCESDEDEAFVARLAERRRVAAMHVGREDVRALARRRKESIEMAARHARHRFFAEAADRAGAGAIFLGHHQDDQIELFFLRLLRGTSAGGLAGMRPWSVCPWAPQVKLARPFLGIQRVAIREYLKERNLEWREDSSNQSLDPLRNRLRADLLPKVRSEYQGALNVVVSRVMGLIRDDEALITGMLDEQRLQIWGEFADWPPALQRRWIAGQLGELGIRTDLELIETLRKTAGKRVSVGNRQWVKRDQRGRIDVTGPADSGQAHDEVDLGFDGGSGEISVGSLEIHWSIEDGGWDSALWSAGDKGGDRLWFDADKVGRAAHLRRWKSGDRFQPIGMEGKPKLQDLFVNAKVPVEERSRRAVAVDAKGEIFWVEGFRMAEAFKLDKESKRRLKWSWRRI